MQISEEDQEAVLEICMAYEEGFRAGVYMFSSSANIYPSDTRKHFAWLLGLENAQQQRMQSMEVEDS